MKEVAEAVVGVEKTRHDWHVAKCVLCVVRVVMEVADVFVTGASVAARLDLSGSCFDIVEGLLETKHTG